MDEEPEYLLKQADRCKAVAKTATDPKIRKTLLDMARDYEGRALAVKLRRKTSEPKPG